MKKILPLLLSPIGWKAYVVCLAYSFLTILFLCGLVIYFANPFRNIPFAPWVESPMMDINQRYQYPSLARNESYDSAVFGTSTGRLLSPEILNKFYGGRWTQLAMNSATAYEQHMLAKLFLRHHPSARRIIFTIDTTWCDVGSDYTKFTFRKFPTWMYDEDPWNDLLRLMDGKTFEISVRAFAMLLGKDKARFDKNGFNDFTPDNSSFNLDKVIEKIYGEGGKREPESDENLRTMYELEALNFPTHRLFERLISQANNKTKVIIVFVPYHYFLQGAKQSRQYQRFKECKKRFSQMAKKRENTEVLDFMIHSPITKNDENFWDPLHFRREVAKTMVKEMSDRKNTKNMHVLF